MIKIYIGHEKNPHEQEKFSVLLGLLNQVAENVTWQKVHGQVYALGFGYTFFNIRIVQDPHSLNENIILVCIHSTF